ncbi:MAG: hypothetical protein WC278_04945 [Bacilli bacterium]
MIKLAFKKLKTKKYIIQTIIFGVVFVLLYTVIDFLNMSYSEMIMEYGWYLVIINVLLNIIMATLSGFLMSLSSIMVEIKGKEGKGASLGFVSILFGMLTYGCTSCVIAFFASIGIAFSVVALPLAGLPYKLISLLLILLGLGFILYEIKQGKCKIKKQKNI